MHVTTYIAPWSVIDRGAAIVRGMVKMPGETLSPGDRRRITTKIPQLLSQAVEGLGRGTPIDIHKLRETHLGQRDVTYVVHGLKRHGLDATLLATARATHPDAKWWRLAPFAWGDRDGAPLPWVAVAETEGTIVAVIAPYKITR